ARGMVGSALVRRLSAGGYSQVLAPSRDELDLLDQRAVYAYMAEHRPDYVFIAAARVGGIQANNLYRADFIAQNLIIETNLIEGAHRAGVQRLMFLGSSCIYPRDCPQPIQEDYLLTGPLEETNEPYAIAKISAIKLCRYYNQQYGTNFISVMPTNLYGPNDNYDLYNSHVLPALIRKFHLGTLLEKNDLAAIRADFNFWERTDRYGAMSDADIMRLIETFGITKGRVAVWGTGSPFREFLHVDDVTDAFVFLMENFDYADIGEFINIGYGADVTIREAAGTVKDIVGFTGELYFDTTKPDGTPKKLLDVSRLSALGWKAKIPLRDGIANAYEWYVQTVPSR
nr:GDP-L-fucose synthase [Spirochaetota bacterium]